MKFRRAFTLFSTLIVLVSMIGVFPVAAQQSGNSVFIRQISQSTTTSFSTAGNVGADPSGAQTPEILKAAVGQDAANSASPQGNAPTQKSSNHPLVGRSESHEHGDQGGGSHGGPLTAPFVPSTHVSDSNPGVFASFDGLNHRDQRLANGGNQFSLEPPDQGLCAGNGFVMEIINDVLRVYDTSGNPKTGVVALNAFYGYTPAINRTTGVYGPFVTDPSCYFDSDTQRWFTDVLTLDVDPASGGFLGTNHLDVAVSTTSDPTGSWVVYNLPVQDDGTQGTPDHSCSLNPDGSGHGPCLGDYPHLGADKYGVYLTTNEYSFFGPEFKSAQVYAFSKSALAANSATVNVVQFDTTGAVHSRNGIQPGFTVWPAISAGGMYASDSGGTEFFMSSNAAQEASGVSGGTFSNELVAWALTNTRSLNSASPNLDLTNDVMRSETYGIPPISNQKVGNTPLVDCLNTPSCATTYLLGGPDPFTESESQLDSNDTRMQQVRYIDGQLWAALDTIVHVHGQDQAGIAYFMVDVNNGDHGHFNAQVDNQGYVGVAGNNVNYPTIAALPNGKGIMAFTLVGQNYYPSAAYTSIDRHGTEDIHVSAAGAGPDDGFSGTFIYNYPGAPRPRWGDYGGAVTDGRNIWIASEFIGQTCTLAQYMSSPFGSCGGTRTVLANWDTHITGVKP